MNPPSFRPIESLPRTCGAESFGSRRERYADALPRSLWCPLLLQWHTTWPSEVGRSAPALKLESLTGFVYRVNRLAAYLTRTEERSLIMSATSLDA